MTAAPIGVVLAGGAGRRMGGSKATVQLAGQPLLWYPLRALGAVLDDLAVVCKEETVLPSLPPDVAIWCDGEPRRHPLVGVASALRAAGGRPVVVCAGDMPLVTAEAVRALVDAPPAPAVVARAGERLEPLLARYAPEALPILENMDVDEPATTVIGRLDPLVVGLPDPRAAYNVNSPEDLLLAEGEGVGRNA